MDTKDNNIFMNKRKFFRVYANDPICTEVSIVSVNEKSIKTNPSTICVKDIGVGGLRFSSKLNLPIGEKIVYEFKISILHKRHYIRGIIVWQKEEENDMMHYGAKFQINESEIPNFLTIFNNLALIIKRNRLNHGCNFCDLKKCPNCISKKVTK